MSGGRRSRNGDSVGMEKDNKGFSLVELIIVVAIMAVMLSFTFYSFSLLTGQDARECANNLMTALGKEKTYALTKSATADCYMEVMQDTDGYYYVRYYVPENAIDLKWALLDKQKIGKGSVDIICTFKESDGSESKIKIQGGQTLIIVFDRVSGNFKKFLLSDGTEGNAFIENKMKETTKECTQIVIDRGRTYELALYSATGKYVLTRTK